ncbi:Uncharacterised protein [Weissella viridescens]|uniref:Uncharacterized protein n=1 Tax=Weissella viridescens TaxID=1629 RepID=A0A380P3H5_WEIVI|nr:Uncharacterised protein [Weissella viridescens]
MNLKKISDKLNLYYQRVKKLYFRVIYVIFKSVVPVRQNHVAFLSDSRSSLSGNFEYIVNEINRRDDPFKMAFALNGTNYQAKSFWMYTKIAWLIGTSKYVLVDDFYPLVYPLKMRKNAELIQVWHAVGAFKNLALAELGYLMVLIQNLKITEITQKRLFLQSMSHRFMRRDLALMKIGCVP